MLPPFQAFLDAHADDVWRFCLAVAGPAEAEDCFQETFLAALKAYPKLESGSNLKSWVMTIAYRKSLDSHRRRRNGARPVPEVPEVPASAASGAPAFWDADLWRAVATLPDKQKAAVAYRFVSDLAYADIAEAIGCSEESARQNVRLGLKKLKEVLG